MRILKVATMIAAIALPSIVQAQQSCGMREDVTKRLSSGYGEKFAGGGLRNSDSIFEVWLSAEKGTWTILMTMPNGKSCVMAAGTNWREALPDIAEGIPG